VINRLTELGCRVEVVDTLSRLDDSVTSVAELAARWATEASQADLVAGNALGGAVAQALLPSLNVPVLLVSAPAKADATLANRLASIAEADDLTTSLQRLAELVAPQGTPVSAAPPAPDDETARRRIAGGMRLLYDLDLTANVLAYQGPLLQFVGERSQLVTTEHVAGEVVVVPGAGMRPQHDRPEFVLDHLDRFAKENLSP
jgi:pimeloyl-ACP methyl ester carboxylesterase